MRSGTALPTLVRRTTLAVAAVLIAALASPGAATAASVTKKDRVTDAPRWADISRVHYSNGAQRVGVRVVIPGLILRGLLIVEYAAPKDDGDGWIKVSHGRGDSARVRVFDYFGHRVACGAASGTWSVKAHAITVSVPHRCLRMAGSGALYLDAFVGTRGIDAAPAAPHLRRG